MYARTHTRTHKATLTALDSVDTLFDDIGLF